MTQYILYCHNSQGLGIESHAGCVSSAVGPCTLHCIGLAARTAKILPRDTAGAAQELPIIPSIAIVSDTSNTPRHKICDCFELAVFHSGLHQSVWKSKVPSLGP